MYSDINSVIIRLHMREDDIAKSLALGLRREIVTDSSCSASCGHGGAHSCATSTSPFEITYDVRVHSRAFHSESTQTREQRHLHDVCRKKEQHDIGQQRLEKQLCKALLTQSMKRNRNLSANTRKRHISWTHVVGQDAVWMTEK